MNPPTALNPDLPDRLALVAEQQNRHELNLIASVICNAAAGMPIADAAGVRRFHFAGDDARLLFLACDVARQAPLLSLLRVARAALKDARYWNPLGPISSGPLWNDESLCLLAESYFHAPSLIRVYANKLIETFNQIRRIEQLGRELEAILGTAPPTPSKSHSEVRALPPGAGVIVSPVGFRRSAGSKRGAA